MNKMKHPSDRAERLRIKAKKERFDYKKADRLQLVAKRLEQEDAEQKEIFNELRNQVSAEEED